MVFVDENDCSFDERINNALLIFTLEGYEDTFILFSTIDREVFDFDNINEKYVKLAYIFKDSSNGGYAYLKAIKDKDVLVAATKRAREFLYNKNDPSRIGPIVMDAFKTLLGYNKK